MDGLTRDWNAVALYAVDLHVLQSVSVLDEDWVRHVSSLLLTFSVGTDVGKGLHVNPRQGRADSFGHEAGGSTEAP